MDVLHELLVELAQSWTYSARHVPRTLRRRGEVIGEGAYATELHAVLVVLVLEHANRPRGPLSIAVEDHRKQHAFFFFEVLEDTLVHGVEQVAQAGRAARLVAVSLLDARGVGDERRQLSA